MASSPETASTQPSQCYRSLLRLIRVIVGSPSINAIEPTIQPLALVPIASTSSTVDDSTAVAGCSRDDIPQPAIAVADDDDGMLPLPAEATSSRVKRRSFSEATAAYREVTDITSKCSRITSTRRSDFSITAAFQKIALKQTITIAHTSAVSHPFEVSGRDPEMLVKSDETIDFRRYTRRLRTVVVVAFLFPLLCILLAVAIVGLSGTIEMNELVTVDDGSTAMNYSLVNVRSSNCCRIETVGDNATGYLRCLRCLRSLTWSSSNTRCISISVDMVDYTRWLALSPLVLSCCRLVSDNSSRSYAIDNEQLSYESTANGSDVTFASTSCSSSTSNNYENRSTNSPAYSFLFCFISNGSQPYFCFNPIASSSSSNENDIDSVAIMLAVTWSLIGIVVILSSMWFSKVVVIQFHRRQLPLLLDSVDAARIHLDLVTVEQRGSDSLLCEMLPRWVADSLKQGRAVDPETFEEGTVYFSDIPGFHDVVNNCESPLDIVSLLNAVFGAFDGCIKQFRVYKVETIGDSYVVASGIPTRIGSDHAAEAALMALDMLNVSTRFSLPGHEGVPLPLRIGMNCGPVVTGVIGFKNPRYCLFGDTVNTASRMESTGKPYHIHCSEAFKRAVHRKGVEFIFEERGIINVKGKGNMTTYWLQSKTEAVAGNM